MSEALLLEVNGVAKLLGESRAPVYRRLAGGKLPPPVFLSAGRRRGRRELETCVEEGCPPAAQ